MCSCTLTKPYNNIIFQSVCIWSIVLKNVFSTVHSSVGPQYTANNINGSSLCMLTPSIVSKYTNRPLPQPRSMKDCFSFNPSLALSCSHSTCRNKHDMGLVTSHILDKSHPWNEVLSHLKVRKPFKWLYFQWLHSLYKPTDYFKDNKKCDNEVSTSIQLYYLSKNNNLIRQTCAT